MVRENHICQTEGITRFNPLKVSNRVSGVVCLDMGPAMNTQKLTIGYTASLFIQWIVAESFHVAIAVEESRKVIEEVFTNDYTWAIELKETGEALVKMIDYCFNAKGFENLWSDFFVDNPASGHLILDEFNENIHLLRW